MQSHSEARMASVWSEISRHEKGVVVLTGRVAEGSSVAKSLMQMVCRQCFSQGDQHCNPWTSEKEIGMPLLSGARKGLVGALRAIRHCRFRLEAITREGIRSLYAPTVTA